jgi:hypothetical protein
MESARFDTLSRLLARSLRGDTTRRAIALQLGGLILGGLVASRHAQEAAAKKRKRRKRRSPPPPFTSPSPLPPPPTCPPTCPACQACNPATLHCEAQGTNGDPGLGCDAPKVCCSGTCCHPIHQCDTDGTCATCADLCDQSCGYCFHLAGGTECGGVTSQPDCSRDQCTDDNDCDSSTFQRCVLSFTQRNAPIDGQGCNQPVGTGVCWTLESCV